MKFNININASPKKVWQVLFSDATYREWTKPFFDGSYFEGSWEEGTKIHFLGPDGSGMYGEIETNYRYEYMAIKQIGELRDFKELPVDEKASQWSGNMETYKLTPIENGTDLEIELSGSESDDANSMAQMFPPALEIIKSLAEKTLSITLEVLVANPIEKIWEHWTSPKHITQWNNASTDWHSPKAENDLKPGGKFNYRMEAKDGSFGFDFGGTYTEVENNKSIKYTLDDDRKVSIEFTKQGDGVIITQTFDAEEENSLDLQKFGWQAIMNNFKTYSESN